MSDPAQPPDPSSRRPLILGNWKMNGDMVANEGLLAHLLALADQAEFRSFGVQAGIAAPFPYLFQVATRLRGRGFDWGAQDVSDESQGPFTAEVSAPMLADFECQFCIVGHSECRQRAAQSNACIARKVSQLLAHQISPVICVGESRAERDAGKASQVVRDQVHAVISAQDSTHLARLTFAYEPIWAIGTGQVASPEDAQKIHAEIRGLLSDHQPQAAQRIRIIYGGSVKADSAGELFSQSDIDGALVGGASLNPKEFFDILQAARSCHPTLQ